jgi:hypothetical protein
MIVYRQKLSRPQAESRRLAEKRIVSTRLNITLVYEHRDVAIRGKDVVLSALE